jgi:hypothetical protein
VTGSLSVLLALWYTFARAIAVVGAAVVVAATPTSALAPHWVQLARALAFLALCALLLGICGIHRELRSSRTTLGWPPALALLTTWVAISYRPTPVANIWPICEAAADEEFVNRVQMPPTIATILGASFAPRPATWLAVSVSQVSFALSHVAIDGGLDADMALWASLRLIGAGWFLASLMQAAGLWVAIGTHALANLAIATATPFFPPAPRAWIAALCLLGVLHLTGSQHLAFSRRGTWREAQISVP